MLVTPQAAADTIRHFAEPLQGESCDFITVLYSVYVLPHIRVFIQTQGVCDHAHVYVCRPLFPTTLASAAMVLKHLTI